MVNDSKKRKTSSSAASPAKAPPVKLTKDEVYNVNLIFNVVYIFYLFF